MNRPLADSPGLRNDTLNGVHIIEDIPQLEGL